MIRDLCKLLGLGLLLVGFYAAACGFVAAWEWWFRR